MSNSKNKAKNSFFKVVMLSMLAFMLATMLSCVKASATEIPVNTVATVSTVSATSPLLGNVTLHNIQPELLAQNGNQNDEQNNDNKVGGENSEDTYEKVINFFITWLRRAGMVVALIGAIMFGLAIKNSDAEQKQSGILTMVAGFVVAAICQTADTFNLFG